MLLFLFCKITTFLTKPTTEQIFWGQFIWATLWMFIPIDTTTPHSYPRLDRRFKQKMTKVSCVELFMWFDMVSPQRWPLCHWNIQLNPWAHVLGPTLTLWLIETRWDKLRLIEGGGGKPPVWGENVGRGQMMIGTRHLVRLPPTLTPDSQMSGTDQHPQRSSHYGSICMLSSKSEASNQTIVVVALQGNVYPVLCPSTVAPQCY